MLPRIVLGSDLELKRLELEAIDKAAQYEKEHPGQANPYTAYVADLKSKAENPAQSCPPCPSPRIERPWLVRNWWWLAAIGIGGGLLIGYSAGQEDGKKSATN